MSTTRIPQPQPTTDPDTRVTAPTWTVQDVRALGMTTSLETAATILGIGRTKAYELARTDQFPVPLLHVGRCYRVPVPAVLHLLGAD